MAEKATPIPHSLAQGWQRPDAVSNAGVARNVSLNGR